MTMVDSEPIATATREQQENFVIVVLAGDIGEWLAEPVAGYIQETSDEAIAFEAIASLNRLPPDERELLLASEAAPRNLAGGDEPTAMRRAMWMADAELLEAAIHLAYLQARASGVVHRHVSAIHSVALAYLERTTIMGCEIGAIVANTRCGCHRSQQHRRGAGGG